MPRHDRRRTSLAVEGLEPRELLSSIGPELPARAAQALAARRAVLAETMEAGLAVRRSQATPPVAPAQNGNGNGRSPGVDPVVSRLRVTINGLMVPAPLVSEGKERGAAVVSGGVAWFLDLSAVRGFGAYAQQLLGKAVVAFGSGEIELDEKTGDLKRKFKVTWMEPLKSTQDLPPAFPDLQPILHPNVPARGSVPARP